MTMSTTRNDGTTIILEAPDLSSSSVDCSSIGLDVGAADGLACGDLDGSDEGRSVGEALGEADN